MKKLQFKILGLWLIFMLTCSSSHAQGISYLSNLGGNSTGSLSVGSNSWLAIEFHTGSNSTGYLLNSMQLAMLEAIGNPSGFNVSLCVSASSFAPAPGSSLAALSGSTNPTASGIYTFNTSADFILLPNTYYWIVLGAGTFTNDGAYQWSTTDTSPTISGNGWQGLGTLVSSDGIRDDGINTYRHWQITGAYTQFALNATPVPEPSTLSLLAIIGLPALLLRRYARKC